MWQQTKLLNLSRFAPGARETEQQPTPRFDPLYQVTCEDLIDFARCPARWVSGVEEPPAKGYTLSDLVQEMVLTKGTNTMHIVREPDEYLAKVMVCPGCDSESHAKHCTACDMDRKPKQAAKAWSAKAKACLEWTARAVDQGLFPIRSGDWDKASAAADAVMNDADVHALMRDSRLNETVVGEWVAKRGDEPIRVAQRLDILPSEGHALDDALGLLYVTADAAHGRHVAISHYRYYHMHAALTLDMANTLGNQEFRHVLQVLVEPTAPYLVARRRLSPQFIAEGRRLVEETLQALSICRKSGKYPTFDPSAPSTLQGWTAIEHDPTQNEGSDSADARFGPSSVALLAAARN